MLRTTSPTPSSGSLAFRASNSPFGSGGPPFLFAQLSPPSSLLVGLLTGYAHLKLEDPNRLVLDTCKSCGGGVASLERLAGSSAQHLYGVVGGGRLPAFISPAKLNIFADGIWKREIGFPGPILGIRCVETKMSANQNQVFFVVACEESLHVFRRGNTVSEMRKVTRFPTGLNPLGCFDVAAYSSGEDRDSWHLWVAYPSSETKGKVEVRKLTNLSDRIAVSEHSVSAHDSEVVCLTLSRDPSNPLLATASKRGTVIRVFGLGRSNFGTRVFSFQRGAQSARVYCLAFSPASKYLVLTSSSSTLHIFSLVDPDSSFLGLSKRKRSIAKVDLSRCGFASLVARRSDSPDADGVRDDPSGGAPVCQTIASFVAPERVVVVGMNGKAVSMEFDLINANPEPVRLMPPWDIMEATDESTSAEEEEGE